MRKLQYCLAAAALFTYGAAAACTNFIVTKGASTDGSAMVSYAADSHALYGSLYHTPGPGPCCPSTSGTRDAT